MKNLRLQVRPALSLRHVRPFALLVALAFGLCQVRPCAAAQLDNAANAKIDESVNVHYVATEFTKAEALLLGTIKACGNNCSNAVLARAYMYIGIVRGAGNGDIKGAIKAFERAVTLDAFVKLDRDLATQRVQKAFEEAGGDLGAVAEPTTANPSARPATSSGASEGADAMRCSPAVSELESRRPLPVACRSSKALKKAVLYYKEFGNPAWNQVNLASRQGTWVGMLPCSATTITGTLRWYVVGMGAQSKPLDSFGSEGAPTEVAVVDATDEPAPALPGQSPPARCTESGGDCPADMAGTPACPTGALSSTASASGLGWGAACDEHPQCEAGLFCLSGSCDMAPSCETDADCPAGSCDGETCSIDRDESVADSGGSAGFSSIFSIQFGADLSLLSGDGVCNPHPDHNSQYQCYLGDTPYATPPRDPEGQARAPELSGQFGASAVPGTLRAMLAYEYVIAGVFGIEAQAGLAFNGAPSAATADLFHAAIRGKYWLAGVGQGLKPFIGLGFGVGEVSARKTVSTLEWKEPESYQQAEARVRATAAELVAVAEAQGQTFSQAEIDAYVEEQLDAERQLDDGLRLQGRGQGYDYACIGSQTDDATGACNINPVNAWLRLGSSFVTGSVGAMLTIGSVGLIAELQAKYMLPRSAIVGQPTLGVAYTF